MPSKAEIGALLRRNMNRDPQKGDDDLLAKIGANPTPQSEPTPPSRRVSRRHVLMGLGALGLVGAGAGMKFGGEVATPANAEVPGTTDPITLRYGQADRLKTQSSYDDSEGPHTTLTIIPSSDIDVTNGTVTTISELKRRYPGSQNTEAIRITDVIHATEPGKPLHPMEIIGYASDLNKDDTNGVVELRPNKRIEVTIWERGLQGLETTRTLAHKEDTVPPFTATP